MCAASNYNILNMERRTFDAPMDFEYDNRHGHLPANSPWMSASRNLQQNFNSLSSRNNLSFEANSMRNTIDKNFDSPSKPNMAFEAGSLRNTLPQTPIKNHVANFRDNPSLDFSSGAENPSSPENADTEATPEVLQRDGVKNLNDNVTVSRGNHHSPGKEAPPSPTKTPSRSLSSYFALPSRFSPSHKQLIRKDQSSRALGHRPTKRKRRDLDHHPSHPESDSDYDAPPSQPSPRKSSKQLPSQPTHAELGLLPSILTFINDHPSLPHIISWWAQMLLSTLVLLFLSYILYSFYAAIRNDVDLKADELSRDLLATMSQCAEDFSTHGCAERVKLGGAFKRMCDEWESCMNQDHRAVGRARISAQTWAGILNGFVEPLSGKIIALGAGAIVLAMVVPHALFGFIRRKEPEIFERAQKTAGIQRQPSQGYEYPGYDRGFSGLGDGHQFFTPSHSRTYDAMGDGNMTGRRSPSKEMMGWGEREGGGSPMKRIGYR